MKPLLIAVGIAGLVLGLVNHTWAHVGERVFPIFELMDEDVALIDIKDGSVEDWEEVVGEPSLTAIDFETYRHGILPYDPFNLDFRIWLAWHGATNRIFVAMERADDVYINEFQRGQDAPIGRLSAWDGSIIFEVDGDHSGGIWIASGLNEEEQRLLWNRQAQGYMALAEVFDQGSQIDLTLRESYGPDQFFLRSPFAEAGGGSFGENPTVSVLECYVTPFDQLVWNSLEESLVSELFPGKIVGLNITSSDIDGDFGSGIFHHLPSSPVGLDRYDASNFYDAILLGPGGQLPDDSAVESITWGRLKAQFVK